MVSDGTGVLLVRVNAISTGTLNQGAFEAGPDVVAGTIWRVTSEYAAMCLKWLVVLWMSTTQFVMHVVVVASTTVLLLPEISESMVLLLPCRIIPKARVAPKINCVCEKMKTRLSSSCVKTVRVGKSDVDKNVHVEPVIKSYPLVLLLIKETK